jgi:hypothetical protein
MPSLRTSHRTVRGKKGLILEFLIQVCLLRFVEKCCTKLFFHIVALVVGATICNSDKFRNLSWLLANLSRLESKHYFCPVRSCSVGLHLHCSLTASTSCNSSTHWQIPELAKIFVEGDLGGPQHQHCQQQWRIRILVILARCVTLEWNTPEPLTSELRPLGETQTLGAPLSVLLFIMRIKRAKKRFPDEPAKIKCSQAHSECGQRF